MRYGYLYTRKHMTMRFILESYQSDSELKECYLRLMEIQDSEINTSFLKRDLIRINDNLEFVENRIEKPPDRERELLYDVYMKKECATIEDLRNKYKSTQQDCYKKIRKAIIKFSELDELMYE